MELYYNNAWTTLAADVEVDVTTVIVSNAAPFEIYGVLTPPDFFRVSVHNEVMKVVEMSGPIWTVERALEGGNTETIPIGTAVIHQATAGMMQDVTEGPEGPAGPGVAAGGTTGQVLAKASDDDYDTEWVDQSGGGGGAFSGAKLIRATDQTIPFATATNVAFSSAPYDTDGYTDVGTDNTKITIPTGKAGYYSVGYNINIAGHNGFFAASILINGTVYPVGFANDWVLTDTAAFSVVMTVFLDEGDYIQMELFQVRAGGGTWDSIASNGSPVMYASFLGT